jgi:hypothetical protein
MMVDVFAANLGVSVGKYYCAEVAFFAMFDWIESNRSLKK